jgi:hypothetical protein
VQQKRLKKSFFPYFSKVVIKRPPHGNSVGGQKKERRRMQKLNHCGGCCFAVSVNITACTAKSYTPVYKILKTMNRYYLYQADKN